MAIKPLFKRAEGSSTSPAATPTSPISYGVPSFALPLHHQSIDVDCEYDNHSYEDDAGERRTSIPFSSDVEQGLLESPTSQFLEIPRPTRLPSRQVSVTDAFESSPEPEALDGEGEAQNEDQKKSSAIGKLWAPVKALLNKFKLLIIIIFYSILGAHMFMWIEAPVDLADKEESYYKRLIARENMYISLNRIDSERSERRFEEWKKSIIKFEEDLELGDPDLETAWSFWMSFLYAGTIYTTIGYGNIACKTSTGRWATMIYAIVGIPIMIIILNDLGQFLLTWLKKSAEFVSSLCLYLAITCSRRRRLDGKSRLRYSQFRKWTGLPGRSVSLSSLSNDRDVILAELENGKTVEEDAEAEEEEGSEEGRPDPPVMAAFAATVGWILLSAATFCLWEDWDFFTSVYFFVISLSTIGLGDVTPAHPEYMIFAFGVVLIGLAMVTVFIDCVKEKIENMYMRLLDEQFKLYLERVEAGDTNAAAQMMADMQNKGKYISSFMSKTSGSKVMDQFKKNAKDKGFDIPAVFTDVDPETGLPAFASANRDTFKELIAAAEEKRDKEEQKERQYRELIETKRAKSMTSSRISSIQNMRSLKSEAPTPASPFIVEPFLLRPVATTTIVQTDIDDAFLAALTREPKSAILYDSGCQTDSAESSDEGIQTWPSMESMATQIELDDKIGFFNRHAAVGPDTMTGAPCTVALQCSPK